MRNQHDPKPIQKYPRESFRDVSRGIITCAWACEFQGYKQYRNWSKESEPACNFYYESFGKSAKKESFSFGVHDSFPFSQRGVGFQAWWKMKRRDYSGSIKLDMKSLKVNLIPVRDDSAEAEQRSYEAIEMVSQLILLSSKRGRTKKSEGEVFNEAA